MTAIVSRTLATVGMFLLLSACDSKSPSIAERPPVCPQDGPIDERCAIEIVRAYAMKEYPQMTWVKFEAKYDPSLQQWFASAEHAPNTPGNYFILYLSPQGQVVKVQGGQ